jgi:WD40 repeat protein
MKKIITIAVLAVCFLARPMWAMEQQAGAEVFILQTNDNAHVRVSKADGLLSHTIRGLYGDLQEEDGTLTGPIPLGKVSQEVLQRLLADLPWVRVVRANKQPDETDEECAERAARGLPASLFGYSAQGLRHAWENLKAAHDLAIPELIERYARIIAGMLVSDESLALLYKNDPAQIALIQEIEPLLPSKHTDSTPEKYAELRNKGPLTIFAKLIYKYIPREGVWVECLMLKGYDFTTASFSPDGDRVIARSSYGTLGQWDAYTGKPMQSLRHAGHVLSASYSPNGSRIVTASSDGTAREWNANTGHILRNTTGDNLVLGHGTNRWVRSASYSPDGGRIVTACSDHNVRIWDANEGDLLYILRGHSDEVYSASYSPDGGRIVSASSDQTVRVWNANTGQLRRNGGNAELALLRGHTNLIWSALFSRDGQRIVSACEDMTARIWDVSRGQPLLGTELVLKGHTKPVYAASFSPDGTMVVTASGDGTVRLWDARTGLPLRNAAGAELVLKGHTDWVRSAAFSSDGKRIVTASSDGTVRIWALTSMINSFAQALFISMLQWAQRNNKSVGWRVEWGKTVMNTYSVNDQALIQAMFSEAPLSWMQKVSKFFGSSSSSSSNNNNNNNNNN